MDILQIHNNENKKLGAGKETILALKEPDIP